MLILLIITFSLLGSVIAVGVAGLFLLFPEKIRRTLVPCLISYASGTLLGAAFLGLIPQALDSLKASSALPTVLAGMVLFFVLEKLVIWRHCHREKCEVHGTAGPLILVGDAFHNFSDGVVIAAAFISSVPLGIATSLAVIAHEVPQEVGDFAILLDNGYSKAKAFIYNTLSGAATLPGALLAYLFLAEVKAATPYIMALSASSFIYIATVDLMPGLHREISFKHTLRQLFLLIAGIGTIMLFHLHK